MKLREDGRFGEKLPRLHPAQNLLHVLTLLNQPADLLCSQYPGFIAIRFAENFMQ
jgi:hypothetical protein